MIGICRTNGTGYWSTQIRDVTITKLILDIAEQSTSSADHGELCAVYDLNTWNPPEHGLIYTDKQWLDQFKAILRRNGFSRDAVDAVDYSEHGMQGKDYVSMDVGRAFIAECDRLLNFVNNQQIDLEIEIV